VSDPLRSASARGVGLLIAAVAAITVIGFVTGTAPSTYRAAQPAQRERADPGVVPPARTHAELERRPWTGGVAASGWQESKVIAAKAAADDEAAGGSVETAVRERAIHRAFDGAPPVIPHPVRARSAAECLACHSDGFTLGDRRASRVPHAPFSNCTQCHVSATAPFALVAANPAAEAPSTWVGLTSPTAGDVAYAGAPPAVPHPTLMREQCEACHGSDARVALRTPHPDRRSCLQCHPTAGDRGARASR
jgi:cytochrome c-type protein NapB